MAPETIAPIHAEISEACAGPCSGRSHSLVDLQMASILRRAVDGRFGRYGHANSSRQIWSLSTILPPPKPLPDSIRQFTVVDALAEIIDHPRRLLGARYFTTARQLFERVEVPVFRILCCRCATSLPICSAGFTNIALSAKGYLLTCSALS